MEQSALDSNPLVNAGFGRPVHGSIRPAELRALGLDPSQVLDFSASISPLGTPAGLWDALWQVDLTTYPDPENLALREALSAQLNVAPQRILVGNGSTEIIHLLARAHLTPPSGAAAETAVLLTPTYGEYLGACRLAGANIFNCNARFTPELPQVFSWDIDEIRRHIIAQRAGLTFVCNPNNPTGVYLPEGNIRVLADAAGEADGLLVLDEAYVNFVTDSWDSLPLVDAGPVVALRSMTKDYALTGLRLGYAVADEAVIARLASFQPDWSVNSLAQAAGLCALADDGYLERARDAVDRSKQLLIDRLTASGYTVLPSAANFLLVEVGNGTMMREQLLRHGLVVRDCGSFGLPQCIRIGIRAESDCDRLAEAMAGLRANG
jgi:histidinol-phosphate aminotransferase